MSPLNFSRIDSIVSVAAKPIIPLSSSIRAIASRAALEYSFLAFCSLAVARSFASRYWLKKMNVLTPKTIVSRTKTIIAICRPWVSRAMN